MSFMGLLCIWGVLLPFVCVLGMMQWLIVVLYIGWAFLPSKVLHFIGVYYYPDRYGNTWVEVDFRWWAVAIPSLAVMTLVYIFAALQGYNRAITPSLDRLECITGTPFLAARIDIDSYARISMEPMKDKKRGTNGVLDLPAGVVCDILYGAPDDVEENGLI